MPLILTETILGELVRALQSHSEGTLDDETCLEIIATSFGFNDPLALLSAVSESEPAPEESVEENRSPVSAFWQSGLLNSFITDYSSRRQPVVLVLSGRDSIIVLSSQPQNIYEILQDQGRVFLQSLGMGPWPKPPFTVLGQYSTPPEAFDALCRLNGWEWAHSSNDEVQ